MPLSTHPENTPVAASERMVEIIRMVRRICLLREDGDMLRARRVDETELQPAVDDYRKMRGDEALPDRALEEIFAIETRRVAEAEVLCELLVPRLVARWPVAVSPGTVDATPVSRISSPVAAPAGPPAIPDLLDAMLALDRAGARRSAAPRSKF
jgi:hypothetical protein